MRIARVDANQPDIVDTFRDLGFTVLHTHTLKNCFDILVGKDGMNYCIEIKDGSKKPSQRRLTPGEQNFFISWKGQVCIIECVEDVLKFAENHDRLRNRR